MDVKVGWLSKAERPMHSTHLVHYIFTGLMIQQCRTWSSNENKNRITNYTFNIKQQNSSITMQGFSIKLQKLEVWINDITVHIVAINHTTTASTDGHTGVLPMCSYILVHDRGLVELGVQGSRPPSAYQGYPWDRCKSKEVIVSRPSSRTRVWPPSLGVDKISLKL